VSTGDAKAVAELFDDFSSAAIASTRRSSVRLATAPGADERSSNPASPSAR